MSDIRGKVHIILALSIACIACIACTIMGCGITSQEGETNITDLSAGNIEEEASQEASSSLEGQLTQDNLIQLQYTEQKVVVPALSKDYQLLFITDSHVVISSENDSEEQKAYANERRELFLFPNATEEKKLGGDSSDAEASNAKASAGITSDITFDRMLSNIPEDIDVLALGGDIIDSPSDSELKYLKNELSKVAIPYAYTMGNHDWTFPWDYMTENCYSQNRGLLNDYMDNNPTVHALDMGEFIILSVDNSQNQFDAEALYHFNEYMEQDKPVIMLIHVPLVTDTILEKATAVWSSPTVLGGGNSGGIYLNDISAEFYNKITAKDSPVCLILAGHIHLEDINYVHGEKDVLQIVSAPGFEGRGVKVTLACE